jgi:hypothetical protein
VYRTRTQRSTVNATRQHHHKLERPKQVVEMDNPYEQQQTALVSRIINNVVCLLSLVMLMEGKTQ